MTGTAQTLLRERWKEFKWWVQMHRSRVTILGPKNISKWSSLLQLGQDVTNNQEDRGMLSLPLHEYKARIKEWRRVHPEQHSHSVYKFIGSIKRPLLCYYQARFLIGFK
ncbi:hypothetical protein QAD02_004111 [Eretmocerus hayati]|uniref:Uncharacterized protein n=1 Tax=Eretmocerus hayati TaxID=131215 RepID=A0ACC2NQH1_9HYME|nr:hypothetical protein QAD02_004111 [Eretmocerus hayati]